MARKIDKKVKPDNKKDKSKKVGMNYWATVRKVGRLTKKMLPLIFLVLMLQLGVSLLSIFVPIFQGEATNIMYEWGKQAAAGGALRLDLDAILQKLLMILLFEGIVFVVSVGCEISINNITSRKLTYRYRTMISDKIRHVPIKFVDTFKHGEIIERMMDDVSFLGTTVIEFIRSFFGPAIMVIALTIIMFVINPILAAVVIIFAPVSIIIAGILSKRIYKNHSEQQKNYGKLVAHIEESYSGHNMIKAYNLKEVAVGDFDEINAVLKEETRNASTALGYIIPVVTMINNFCFVFICAIGAILAINGMSDIGEIVTFIIFSKLFAQPIEQISNALGRMQLSVASAERVYDILDQKEMSPEPIDAIALTPGVIEVCNVDFSYDPKTPLITDLNLTAEKGSMIAIVGPTGAGKTTIVNLLMRFYDVDSGTIRMDGIPVYDTSRENLRDVCGMVLQDTWLFTGTIYENIAYAKQDADPELVYAAARAAHIDRFIRTLPDGYETQINEDGTNISQGQKQLITIARAFLADKPVLILDEATSNVDTRTEMLIQKAMRELIQNKTCFIIAHRLSTIIDADNILVMNEGKIIEQGTHTQLMAQGGFYTELYNSQFVIN